MRVTLPHTLHYPITVTALLKQPEDAIERGTPLFSYTYTSTATGSNEDGTPFDYKHTYTSRFESSVDGTLKRWMLRRGDVVARGGGDVAEVDEPCTHSVQYGGMCAYCGKDMTELSYATAQVDASRANINMIHDNTALTVSQDEATKVETEAKRRLIAARKLSLVVDLDQTIIHATVDPTVAEWQRDPSNPNYEAVRDVQAFQLVDDGPGGRGTWYYIKLRPGLSAFLENISKIYELHIYTMGTRAYAQNIANLIDPDRRIFGDRILSRDESGSMVAKNLQRLFPVDTKMVVIIDDRGDVWNWNPNLIKVTQFSFFIGIGDINSSFLPKRPSAPPVATDDVKAAAVTSDETVAAESAAVTEVPSTEAAVAAEATPAPPLETSVSTLEQLVSMGGGDDPNVLQEQSAKQDEVLTAQLQERPLLQKQKELEAEEESDADAERPRHHLLNDDDNELYFLERSLKRVHTEFFDVYQRKVADVSGGRLAELRGSQGAGRRRPAAQDLDLEVIPDIKVVMPAVKARVLAGVTIVFSGVIPLGTDPHSCEIVIWARSFGARVMDTVSRRTTTHVVAARNRTAKVRQAVKRGRGRIKVVSLHWLMDCIVQWEHVEEDPYLLSTTEEDLGRPFADELDDDELLSASDSPADSPIDSDAEPPPSAVVAAAAAAAGAAASGSTGPPRLSLRTTDDTDDEELASLQPRAALDELSPVGGSGADWTEMHAEMKEFLGSSDDDDDDDDDDDGNSSAADDDDDDDAAARSDAGSEVSDVAARAARPTNGAAAPATDHLHPSAAKRSHADMAASDSESSVGSSRAGASPRRKKRSGGSALARRGPGGSSATAAAAAAAAAAAGDDDGGGWSDFDEAALEAELLANGDDE